MFHSVKILSYLFRTSPKASKFDEIVPFRWYLSTLLDNMLKTEFVFSDKSLVLYDSKVTINERIERSYAS